jgi:hypothetical protein
MSSNNTSNITNSSYSYYYYYYGLDYTFNSVGYVLLTDQLYTFLITSVSVIGLFLNILSLLAFNHNDLPDMPLYKYLKVYTTTGMIINFFYIFEFLSISLHYIPFARTYVGQVYYNFILIPIASTGYFYGSVLDIIITLDRIANFSPRVKSLMTLSAYKTSAIAFIATVAVNFAFFFVYTPTPLVNPKTGEQVGWYCGLTAFATSQPGTILTFIVYALRDVVLLALEIALNFASVYFLSRHLKKKSKLVRRRSVHPGTTVNRLDASLAITTQQQRPRVDSLANQSLQQTHQTTASVHRQTKSTASASRAADRNLTFMAVCLSALSLLEHFMYVAGIVFPYFSSNIVAYNIISVFSDFFVTFKQTSNFFIFFSFNKNFRKCVFKVLKVSSN